ncbi:MAG TPA: SpoIIE family protein phosphatase [Polyangiaceae bacterium]
MEVPIDVPLDPRITWTEGVEGIPVIDEASVALVRERVREEAARVGLGAVPAAALVNVASELAQNQRLHAREGVVVVRTAVRGQQMGLEVVAADRGEGIADVARALEGRPSRPGSLGVGLAAVLELADEVDIDTRMGEGTCVCARKFDAPAPRRPRVGVYGRPFPGERISGDDAAFVRTVDALLVAVADGLGHGEPARQASVRAARLTAALREAAPERLLAETDRQLAQTRGTVMAAARLDEGSAMSVAGVGNVSAHVYGPGVSWRFGGSSYFLGSPGGARRIALEQRQVQTREILVLFSDGIRSRMDLTGELDLMREHPAVIAQRIVERFGRDDDDVLVMVVG